MWTGCGSSAVIWCCWPPRTWCGPVMTGPLLGGRGDRRAWSGRFLVEENAAAPLLAVLPSASVIRAADTEFDWLPPGAGLLTAELADPTAGSRAIVS
ncbi:Cupin [Nocardia amikacinitolerans]|uniref:Cupin n=2 Tax=Nocardia amikacinitolerans TaxID=756689 RepID=A0A285LTY5_9NOCA|nr:cupin domain-containing protein [Nocardia amikacinitolerans]MCP2297182.1 Cupin [Nocardia amikacinitolerans]SNY88372.1 Cupin [Nocardia amikacinitolerans]